MSEIAFLCQNSYMALYNPQLIKKLENELEKDPKSKSFCVLAQIYYRLGEKEKAKIICEEGLNHHAFYSPAYVLLAEIYYTNNDFSKAIELLNQAKELDPDNPNIYKHLAQIYKKQKQPEQALQAYKMWAFLEPTNSTALLSFQHLEKMLNPTVAVQKKISSSKKTALSPKQEDRLKKLNQILARVDNYISKGAQI